MPFKSARQEQAMMINSPTVWKRWVKKYGHHPGFKAQLKKSGKKAAGTRKRRATKRRRK